MDWLNYHHLLYFWVVAREGNLVHASRKLRLAKPTISGQIRKLEESLDAKLFERKAARLVLTDVGRVVFRYADQIFALGSELTEVVREKGEERPQRLVVGVADVLPKAVVRRLLEPALAMTAPVRLICREGRSVEDFLGDLAVHAIDVVLSDRPVGVGAAVRAFSHLLGECGTTFFAAKPLAERCRGKFPRLLEDVPCLLPGAGSVQRVLLEQWFHSAGLTPTIVGEFDDPALMNVFGQDGVGVFPAPSAIESDLVRRFQVKVIGRVPTLRQRFYALSVERRLKHPAVSAISEAARKEVFA